MSNWNPNDAVIRLLEQIRTSAASNLRNHGYDGSWEDMDLPEMDTYLENGQINIPYPESTNLAVLEMTREFERHWQTEPDRGQLVIDAANLFRLAADSNIDLVSPQRVGGRKSGVKRRADKIEEWDRINRTILDLKESHPHITSFSRLAEMAAKRLRCSVSTVKRRASNPYRN